MMKITVIQPPYYAGENPDENIARFLLDEVKKAENGSLILLPEYSNAAGLSDKEDELKALPRARVMLEAVSRLAKEKNSYIAINVLEERDDKIKNSTYFFDKKGNKAFI